MRMFRMDHAELDGVAPTPLPEGYTIRPYARDDWEACVELMLVSPDPAYDAGPWNRELCLTSLNFSADEHWDYPEGRGQLVFAGDELVAMALSSATGYLNQVYVRDGHRRRGLAAAAITRVIGALREQGLTRCFLMVFTGNLGARLCYESLGFVATGPGADWIAPGEGSDSS